ncbi:MAG: cyclic nucleotide-binding domain-containing protein [bacterium]
MPRLVVFTPRGRREFPFETKLSIGREKGNELRIELPDVSRNHAMIHKAADGFHLVDLGSTTGVRVNGTKVQQVLLKPGDEIGISMAKFLFLADEDAPSAPKQEPVAAPEPRAVETPRVSPAQKTKPLADIPIPPEQIRNLATDAAVGTKWVLGSEDTASLFRLPSERGLRLFKGLSVADARFLQEQAGMRRLRAGQLLFRKGDPGFVMYVILRGEVEIRRPFGTTLLCTTHGPLEIFGEIALLTKAGIRTAEVRAVQDTELLEFTSNPADLLDRVGDPWAACRLMDNLMTILAIRVRMHQERLCARRGGIAAVSDASRSEPTPTDDDESLNVLEPLVPRSLFGVMKPRRQRPAGDVIFRREEKAHGFYLLHSGTVDMFASHRVEQTAKPVLSISAPCLVGAPELFAGDIHPFTGIAGPGTETTFIPKGTLSKLVRRQPRAAMSCQLAICRLLVRQLLQLEKMRFEGSEHS